MAIISLVTIKSYFERDDKPTEKQFEDTWDSYWHKQNSASIALWIDTAPWGSADTPIAANINRVVNGVETSYPVPVLVPEGNFTIHKAPGNSDNTRIQLKDIIVGFIVKGGVSLFGWWQFTGTDTTDLENDYEEVNVVESDSDEGIT